MSQTLPPRESKLFKDIGKYHEKKQYKKALRSADDILKVHKDHGETLAMKALTLNSLEKKAEAYESIRLGVRNNLRSPVCWHVYGLIHRSDRNYEEAKKCYLNAMKHDKQNLAILRDLSLLQIQLRDLNGYLRTKKALLQLKPSRPESWYTFAMAWELMGHFNEAIAVMVAFEDVMEGSQRRKNEEMKPNFETSERKLYIARLYEQAERYEDALNYLKTASPQIVDKHGVDIMRASLLLKLGRLKEAEAEYRHLLNENNENAEFHTGLQKSLGYDIKGELTDEQVEGLKNLYTELGKLYPRGCIAIKRIPLSFVKSKEDFTNYLHNYLKPALRKGIPSVFGTFKEFYVSNSNKVEVIGDTALSYYNSLKATQKFPGDESDELESPSVILWTMLFLAQHFDKLNQTKRALEFIDEAIAHTPTVIDIYAFRAKILKHAGDLQGAADSINEARELDLADRYLNTKTTIYMMRADRVEQADSIIELFTKDADNHQVSLSEMQCIWYEQNGADSYLRTKQYGRALKKALSIDTHFQDFTEDQFDFHSYCLRKLTLRAYYDLLRFEDRLYSHINYYNAASTIVKTYLAIFDRPVTKELTEEELFAGLTGAELRKAKNKYRKTQLKKAADDKLAKEQKEKELQKKKKTPTTDEEAEFAKLESVENPLNEASKFVASMGKWCSDKLDTHLLSFEVYIKKKKYLLALRALKRSIAIDSDHHQVHYNKIALSLVDTSGLSELVKSIFESQLTALIGSSTPAQLNNEYLEKYSGDLLKRAAGLRATLLIDPSSKDSLKEKFKSLEGSNVTRQSVATVLTYIESIYGNEEAQAYKVAASNLFPYASVFKSAPAAGTV